MLAPATRQDIQTSVDSAKSILLAQLAPKNYIQGVAENLRMSIVQNLQTLHAENQIALRNNQTNRDILLQRVISLELQMKTLNQNLARMIEQNNRAMGIVQRM